MTYEWGKSPKSGIQRKGGRKGGREEGRKGGREGGRRYQGVEPLEADEGLHPLEGIMTEVELLQLGQATAWGGGGGGRERCLVRAGDRK